MKHILKHAWHTIWLTCAVVIIVMAVLISITRMVAPIISSHQTVIVHWISTMVNRPIQIESVTIGWRGLRPVIQCEQVVVLDSTATTPLLKANELIIAIDLLESLLSGHIQLAYIAVSGAQLTVQQNADKTISLYGVGTFSPNLAPTGKNIFTGFAQWVLLKPQIHLEDITLVWYRPNGTVLPIDKINLTLHNHGNEHWLLGDADLKQIIPAEFAFVLDIVGDPRNLAQLKANFYIEAQDVLLKSWLNKNANLDQGMVSVKIWGGWQKQQLQDIQSQFELTDLKFAGEHPFGITSLNGNLLLHPLANGDWQFASDLASENAQVDFGPMFSAAIPLEQFKTHVEGQYDNSGLEIQTSQLSAQNQDGLVTGDFGVFIPSDDSGAELSIMAAVKSDHLANFANYLPLTILKPKLITWLEQSIKKIGSLEATLVINGKAADFPFDNSTGTFIVDSNINDAQLQYKPDWPMVTNLAGELIFNGRQMEFLLQQGQTLSIPINSGHVVIPILKKGVQAVLNIDGAAESTVANGLAFLRATPLHTSSFGKTINKLEGDGPTNVNLHLTVPLEPGATEFSVSGQANLNNNTITVLPSHVQLQNLTGLLNFTQDGINADKLTAQLWGKPVNLSIVTAGSTRVKINYEDILATLAPQQQGWGLSLNAPGMIGQIQIPDNSQQPYQAHFEELHINSNSSQQVKDVQPNSIPRINLVADDFSYNDTDYGKLAVNLSPLPDGVAIDSLAVTGPYSTLDATGNWRRVSGGDWTQLQGTVTSPNINAALQNWGYPAGITAKQSQLQFLLSWPGPAYNPSFNRLRGHISLLFKEGQLNDVGSQDSVKVGLGHLLTLVSLESLAQYLTFDFSNVTAKGFGFDEIKGDFMLKEGDAFTQNMHVNGQMANVTINGRIGLTRKDYDLTVKIMPNLTASLPIIASIIGGPIAGPIIGAGIWVASKILRPAVGQISADDYHIVGSWGNPVVKKIPATGQQSK